LPLLGLVLADDKFVQEHLHFLRLGQAGRRGAGGGFRAVVFKNGIADRDTLVANVSAGIITGRGNQLGDGVL